MASKITACVSCIVPTFRRPEGLAIALESLVSQKEGHLIREIIVADNDPEGSAQTFVHEFAQKASQKALMDIIYLHVPQPGVSNARNAALNIAKGRYIAWLDDDQQAGPDWVSTLLRVSRQYETALTFCPTQARIPGQSPYHDFFETFFERRGPSLSEGVVDEFFGCGNSLMDLHVCDLPDPPFCPKANETGGEDDILFTHIQNMGGTMGWTRHCLAYEDIRPHRATAKYILLRSFAFGQGPSEHAARNQDVIGIIKWMLIGTGQFVVHTPLALMSRIIAHRSYIKHLSKAASGAGKVLWFGWFNPKLYGQAVVAKSQF